MGRRRGNTTFPVARIKKMMQSDEDVGKIATTTPALVGKALECLMEDVLRSAAVIALARNTRTISPQHLKECIGSNDQFDFLRPTVASVPSLDDPSAPPLRRNKRPRGSPAASSCSVPAAPQAIVAKRPRASRPTTPVSPSAPVTNAQSPLPSRSPSPSIAPSPQQSQPPPPPPPPPSKAQQDEDEDYDDDDDDEDDDEEDTPTTATMEQEDRSPPTPTHAAKRVSVQALLS